jgi:zinc transport system substrate-binding protein
MTRTASLTLALALALTLSLTGACSPREETLPEAPPPAEEAALRVETLSYPVDWLVSRIGADDVAVHCVLPEGEDPAHWQPLPETVTALQDADLIVANGATFEAWTETATLPSGRYVDTSAGLDLIESEGKVHAHGTHGKHSHAGVDPHTWADPLLFAEQARVVKEALVAADPDNAPAYRERYEGLRSELGKLSEETRAAIEAVAQRSFASNHPAYAYLARRMGIQIRAFDLAPDEAPSEEQVAAVREWAAGAEEPVMLWEEAPDAEVTGALPEGIEHVVLDPLEQPGPEGYDYLAQARRNLEVWRELAR